MKETAEEKKDTSLEGQVNLQRPILGNTLIFLDTGFFKNYKARNEAYQALLQYSQDSKIILCTSDIYLEEWRAQKVKNMEDNLQSWESQWSQNIVSHCGENFFSQELILSPLREALSNLFNKDQIQENSKKLTESFLEQYQIK